MTLPLKPLQQRSIQFASFAQDPAVNLVHEIVLIPGTFSVNSKACKKSPSRINATVAVMAILQSQRERVERACEIPGDTAGKSAVPYYKEPSCPPGSGYSGCPFLQIKCAQPLLEILFPFFVGHYKMRRPLIDQRLTQSHVWKGNYAGDY